MKTLIYIFWAFSFFVSPAAKKVLDSSLYDEWRTIKKFLVSDDSKVTITEYERYKDRSTLVVKIDGISPRLTIEGGADAVFTGDKSHALYKIKDTLFSVNLKSGGVKKITVTKEYDLSSNSPHIMWLKGNVLHIYNPLDNLKDTIENVLSSIFLPSGKVILSGRLKEGRGIVMVETSGKNTFKRDTLHKTAHFLRNMAADKRGDNIIFFTFLDSAGTKDVKVKRMNLKTGRVEDTGLDETVLPAGTKFNIKKDVTFSSDDDYYKFEISPVRQQASVDARERSTFEYELWRWNDTLLPSQRRGRESIFANSLKCIFYPKERKFIQLTRGRGVFLLQDDTSNYGIELDNRPYMFTDIWEDPIPKDFYLVNRKNGNYSLLFEGFIGSFWLSTVSDHIFTYEPDSESWFVTDLNTRERRNLSSQMPYPVKNINFDKPQPAGNFGYAGLSKDKKYFIVYDQYDIWALPLNQKEQPFCLTNGYGRANKIRFKILNTASSSDRSRQIDLNRELILESVNYHNMFSGFYTLSPGKNPQKLIEDSYSYKYLRQLAKIEGRVGHIVQRESFGEAPDYWITDDKFNFTNRLTDLNNQTENYSFGNSQFIKWSDSSGNLQTGILYTPEDYDSSKTYPVIVYFYETMSQDIFMFYPPAPSTSTINPAMFVSRGYVVFMPDIRFEIGWPGPSSLNIVESGTRHLIDKGIADPQRIGLQGHSWGGYQVAYIITQTDLFTCACAETAVANMTSAYTGLRAGAGKPRMFMYESTQSRIGGTLWDRQENYILNSPLFFLDRVTTPLLSRHSDADEAVPYSQGLELFLGLKRLGKQVWMFNYKGDGHNIKKREIALDWTIRMDQFFDYYLMDSPKPDWMD